MRVVFSTKGLAVLGSTVRSFVLLAPVFLVGCNAEPPLHSISGKVTLGGKPYEPRIVYFRPVWGEVTRFNLGVGEAKKDKVLKLRSSTGMGLQQSKYKATFSCFVLKSGETLGIDQKTDGIAGAEQTIPTEIEPEPYVEKSDGGKGPVEFEIKAGENVFAFDVRAK